MGYGPKDLDEYTRLELQAELARREEALSKGICDYCGRSGKATPVCKFSDRHLAAAVRATELNRVAAGIPQVGVNHVGFNFQGTRSGRSHMRNTEDFNNTVPSLDTFDRGRFEESYPTPPACGKTGCPKPGHNQVVGSLTYHACNDHVDEIRRLVDSE